MNSLGANTSLHIIQVSVRRGKTLIKLSHNTSRIWSNVKRRPSFRNLFLKAVLKCSTWLATGLCRYSSNVVISWVILEKISCFSSDRSALSKSLLAILKSIFILMTLKMLKTHLHWPKRNNVWPVPIHPSLNMNNVCFFKLSNGQHWLFHFDNHLMGFENSSFEIESPIYSLIKRKNYY